MNQLSITKEEINELPIYQFEGDIELIETEEHALEAINKLKNESVLGFDTETRAAFKKGESYDICLIQLATAEASYLFRINKFELTKELVDLLADGKIIKAGVAISDDIKGIKKLIPFKESGFVELADLARKQGIKNFGLRALTAIFIRKRLSKKVKASNWERDELSAAQIHYAAADAVVGYLLYQHMN